jgi:hypothetical protein
MLVGAAIAVAGLRILGYLVAVGGWMSAIIAYFGWFNSPYPRCDSPYGGGWLGSVTSMPWMPDNCRHCGLPYGAEQDPDADRE